MKDRTYRYFTGQPLYTFGYGLSYTTFAYRHLKLPATVKAGDPLTVEADVKNTGSRAGDEVAELYLTQPRAFETPLRTLAAFQRIHLAPGASTHISLIITPRTLGQVDAQGNRIILPGDYTLSLGSTQPGASTNTQTAHFTVTGRQELPK
jgi:beta-glucosidase